jgi:hypothetical protein
MPHIVLLGDSIFDNYRYVHPEPDVLAQLQHLLPEGWTASSRALDGSTTTHMTQQMLGIPEGATHLVLSVAGNDLLGWSNELINTPVNVSSEVLLMLAQKMDRFEVTYRWTVEYCLGCGLPPVLCTIYNGNSSSSSSQNAARVAVALFNDVILRLAREKNLKTIDLRQVCVSPEDYANPIEPSAIGGKKIAQAIWEIVKMKEQPSTNYVADDEKFPNSVLFANGRRVRLVYRIGEPPHLDVEMADPAEVKLAFNPPPPPETIVNKLMKYVWTESTWVIGCESTKILHNPEAMQKIIDEHVAEQQCRAESIAWPMTQTKSKTVLEDFVKYCFQHPEYRFWQALRNWCGHNFVYVSETPYTWVKDTFHWEGKNG